MRRLAAVHFASDDPLRVLHRDFPHALLDEDDADDDRHDHNSEISHLHDVQEQCIRISDELGSVDLSDRCRDTGDDSREDDDRNPVADALSP